MPARAIYICDCDARSPDTYPEEPVIAGTGCFAGHFEGYFGKRASQAPFHSGLQASDT
jgi:hypothetical protein